MHKFPERLKYLRVSNGLTQGKLSEDISKLFNYPVTKTTISLYENGNREPSLSMLVYLAKYFNCSVDYLLGLSDHLHIINSDEFSNKIALLKAIVDAIPKMDYINAHELNKLVNDYLKSNGLK